MSQLYPYVRPARSINLESPLAGESAAIESGAKPVETSQAVMQRLLSTGAVSERKRIAYELTHGELRAACSDISVSDIEQVGFRSKIYAFAKRLFDLIVSATLMIVLVPVFVLVSLAIWLDDRGPVLYYQTRIGRDGRSFRFYKFRSMVCNADALKSTLKDLNEAEGPIFKIRQDPRITRVGRFLRRYSIDEIPQLFNVLMGNTTLIGPRPLVVPEADMCDDRQYLRHLVKPGLFCLREISGRSELSFSEWMELDLLYVINRSFATDMLILLYGIPVILRAQGAC